MDDTRFDQLLTRLLDDELTPHEWTEYAALARQNPERQRRMQEQLEAADLIAQAEDELRASPRFVAAVLAQTTADPFVGKVTARLPSARLRWWFWFGACAAGLLLTVGLAVILWPKATPFARIAEVNGPVQWTGEGGHVTSESLVGRTFSVGTLESLSVDSWAVLEYGDGSRVTLAGRSQLTVVDGPRKELRLGYGRMSASVTPQPDGRPMLIHTPTADLEVVGTQLNVESDSVATVVSVNEGRVRLTRLVDGGVADVPADHRTVASVDRHAELKVVRRPNPVGVWRSQFPRGVNYGDWQTTADSGLRTKSLLLNCAKPKPLLVFVASASVAAEDSSPLVLADAGRFVVRGRLGSTAEVFFGVTMNHPKGGFAGKYFAVRKIDVGGPGGEPFEWAVPFDQLQPVEGTFPASPVGLEIVECWCLTITEDHGLSVHDIELKSDSH